MVRGSVSVGERRSICAVARVSCVVKVRVQTRLTHLSSMCCTCCVCSCSYFLLDLTVDTQRGGQQMHQTAIWYDAGDIRISEKVFAALFQVEVRCSCLSQPIDLALRLF